MGRDLPGIRDVTNFLKQGDTLLHESASQVPKLKGLCKTGRQFPDAGIELIHGKRGWGRLRGRRRHF